MCPLLFDKDRRVHCFAHSSRLDGIGPNLTATTTILKSSAEYTQDKKEAGRIRGGGDHHKREEEQLEQEVHPHNTSLGTAFIPVLLFTRYVEHTTTFVQRGLSDR